MRINSIQSCARKLHQESQCTGQPADWRKGGPAWKGLNKIHGSRGNVGRYELQKKDTHSGRNSVKREEFVS